MPKPKELTADMFAGNFVSEAEPKRDKRNRKIRMVNLKCYNCKKVFSATVCNAKRTQQKCCSGGCHNKLVEHFEGGNERHPLYSTWLAMRQRCLYPKSSNYPNYGGRGITISSSLQEFVKYVSYIESLEKSELLNQGTYTIDRIDNDGNYQEGNLRVVNKSVQVVNQRPKQSISKAVGIFQLKPDCFRATVNYKHKNIYRKTFTTMEEAIMERNKFILENNLPHPLTRQVKEI